MTVKQSIEWLDLLIITYFAHQSVTWTRLVESAHLQKGSLHGCLLALNVHLSPAEFWCVGHSPRLCKSLQGCWTSSPLGFRSQHLKRTGRTMPGVWPSHRHHTVSLLLYWIGQSSNEGQPKFQGMGHRFCLLMEELQTPRRAVGWQILLQSFSEIISAKPAVWPQQVTSFPPVRDSWDRPNILSLVYSSSEILLGRCWQMLPILWHFPCAGNRTQGQSMPGKCCTTEPQPSLPTPWLELSIVTWIQHRAVSSFYKLEPEFPAEWFAWPASYPHNLGDPRLHFTLNCACSFYLKGAASTRPIFLKTKLQARCGVKHL
jgi:hypothetical protein